MPIQKTVIKVGQDTLRFEPLPGQEGMLLFFRLLQIIGPAFEKFLMLAITKKGAVSIEEIQNNIEDVNIVVEFLSRTTPETLGYVIKTLRERCEFKDAVPDSKKDVWLDFNENLLDVTFQGQTMNMLVWMRECLAIQYADFLSVMPKGPEPLGQM